MTNMTNSLLHLVQGPPLHLPGLEAQQGGQGEQDHKRSADRGDTAERPQALIEFAGDLLSPLNALSQGF